MVVERKSNFDLLRIVAMIMVITIHYVGWGGSANNTKIGEANFFIAGILAVLSQVGVNCFYLISGYFLKEGQNINWKKGVCFWGQILFYSVTVPIILALLGYIKLDLITTIKTFLPIITNQYWFASIFIVVILISPLLSLMTNKLTNKQLRNLLIVVFFIDSIQPMFFHNAIGEDGYGLVHAIFMILIGNYIRKVDFSIKNKWIGLLIYFSGIGLGSVINIGWLVYFGERNKIILDYNSPFVIISSIYLFVFFKQLNFKNVFVSKIAPYIFAVYLVNDNNYMRNIVYKDILKCDMFYHSEYFIIHYIVSVFLFMVIGISIDFMRKRLGKLLNIHKLRGVFNG